MNEIPRFNGAESQPTPPDNQQLSLAMARRFVGDISAVYAGNVNLDVDPTSFPSFFIDAQVKAMAKGISSALKTPSPFAAFFDSTELIVDEISNGDALAFVDETGIEDSTPRQVILFGKALNLANNRIFGSQGRLPEMKYPHFMAMVKDADEMAAEHGIEKAAIYGDDNLYHELIRRNISQDEYESELKGYISELTFDKYMDFIASLVSFSRQVEDNPQGVDATGFTIDEDEILEERKNLEALPFFLDQQVDNYETTIVQGLESINNRINTIWGSTDNDLQD